MQVRQRAAHRLASAALYLGVFGRIHEVRDLDRKATALTADDLEARLIRGVSLRDVHGADAPFGSRH